MATVQTRSGQTSASSLTVAITTTAGNLLGVATGAFGAAAGAPTRTGDTFANAVPDFADAGGDHIRGDYAKNIAGGSTAVVCNGSVNGTAGCVTEFSGRDTVNPLGAVNHAAINATQTTIQPGSITPAAGSDLMTAQADDGGGSSAATIDSSFTVDEAGGVGTVWDNSGTTCGTAHLDNVANSAINPTWTSHHSTPPNLVALIMEFKQASGGGPTTALAAWIQDD